MKIALIGYGKMGKAIEEIALASGHEICVKINNQNTNTEFLEENFSSIDVAIEFTNPHSAAQNIKKCFELGVPVVSGTTGWLDNWDELINYCSLKNGTFLYASNFSIGVNIFFELNKYLSKLMADKKDYNVEIKEIHHTKKIDSPSGTAITLAEGILENSQIKKSWVNESTDIVELLSVISKRVDPAPGTHIIKYYSEIDDIEIIHTAHNRKGFATGAIKAAEYVVGKKGVFTMKEVIGL